MVPPSFLDPNFFVDHVVAPYPNGPSSIGFFVVISLNLGASSFASPHVQNSQDHEPIPHVNLSYFLSDMESNPPCKKHKFVDGKIQKKSYDSIHKFQTKWVVKMPWIEGLVAKDGFINMVKCKMCYFD